MLDSTLIITNPLFSSVFPRGNNAFILHALNENWNNRQMDEWLAGWLVRLGEVQKLQSTNSIFVEQSRKPFWRPSGKAIRWESHVSGGDETNRMQHERGQGNAQECPESQGRQCVWNVLVLNFQKPSTLIFRAWAPEAR